MAINRPSGTYDSSYGQDMAIFRTRLQWLLLVAGLIFTLTLPLYANGYILYLLNTFCITLIVVLGLNILFGYCGVISLGQSAFMAVGAYTAGAMAVNMGASFWVALPCSALATGLVGMIFGLPALRIKGFYLAVSTLAAQFILVTLFLNVRPDIFGGSYGLQLPAPKLGNIVFNTPAKMFYIIIPITLVMLYFAKNIVRTGVGRAFIAIRDNDLAAEVAGIDVFRYKLLAFFTCNIYAGIAGCLWAFTTRAITPDQFTLHESVWFLGMAFVGGIGTTIGPVFGTFFIRGLDELVKAMSPLIFAIFPTLKPEHIIGLGPAVFAIVVISFILLEPRGLAHRWEILKTSYRMNPFAY